METTAQTHFTDKIINGLKKAATELEEFRLQATLGKADLKDAYEEAKRKFNEFIHEAKLHANDAKEVVVEKSVQLKTLLEELQVQLALGKADTKDIFEEQRKKITHALNDLETHVKKNKIASEYYTKFLLEIGKFRIKLDILKMHYELNKLEGRIEFEDKKKEFLNRLSEMKERLFKHEETMEDKWEHFSSEISDAYSHLKKAFVK